MVSREEIEKALNELILQKAYVDQPQTRNEAVYSSSRWGLNTSFPTGEIREVRVHDRDPDKDKRAYEEAKKSVKETVLKFQRNALPAIVCIKGHPLHDPYRRENKPLLTILMEHFDNEDILTFIDHGVVTAPQNPAVGHENHYFYQAQPLYYVLCNLGLPGWGDISKTQRKFLELAHELIVKRGVKLDDSNFMSGQLGIWLKLSYQDSLDSKPTKEDTWCKEILDVALPQMDFLSPSKLTQGQCSTCYNIFHRINHDNIAFMHRAVEEFKRRIEKEKADPDTYGITVTRWNNDGSYHVQELLHTAESLAYCMNERHQDTGHETPLMIATNTGDIAAVRLYLDAGANPMLTDSTTTKRLVHGNIFFQAFKKSQAIFKLLLEHASSGIKQNPHLLLHQAMDLALNEQTKKYLNRLYRFYEEQAISIDFSALLAHAAAGGNCSMFKHVVETYTTNDTPIDFSALLAQAAESGNCEMFTYIFEQCITPLTTMPSLIQTLLEAKTCRGTSERLTNLNRLKAINELLLKLDINAYNWDNFTPPLYIDDLTDDTGIDIGTEIFRLTKKLPLRNLVLTGRHQWDSKQVARFLYQNIATDLCSLNVEITAAHQAVSEGLALARQLTKDYVQRYIAAIDEADSEIQRNPKHDDNIVVLTYARVMPEIVKDAPAQGLFTPLFEAARALHLERPMLALSLIASDSEHTQAVWQFLPETCSSIFSGALSRLNQPVAAFTVYHLLRHDIDANDYIAFAFENRERLKSSWKIPDEDKAFVRFLLACQLQANIEASSQAENDEHEANDARAATQNQALIQSLYASYNQQDERGSIARALPAQNHLIHELLYPEAYKNGVLTYNQSELKDLTNDASRPHTLDELVVSLSECIDSAIAGSLKLTHLSQMTFIGFCNEFVNTHKGEIEAQKKEVEQLGTEAKRALAKEAEEITKNKASYDAVKRQLLANVEHARLEAEAEQARLEAEAAEQARLEAEAEQAPAVVIPAHYDGDDTQASDNPKPSTFGALARMGSIGAGLAMSGIAIAAGATIIALALSAPHVLVALATTALVVKTAALIGVSVHSTIIGLGAAITTVGVAMGLGVAGISKHHSQAVTADCHLVASQIGSGIRCAVSCAPCCSPQQNAGYAEMQEQQP